jgi:hypothetical protein
VLPCFYQVLIIQRGAGHRQGSDYLFGEPGDDGLRGADDSRFEFFYPVGESVNEPDDRRDALIVNPEDVSLAEQVHRWRPESK